MKFLHKKKDYSHLSMPRSITVRGIEIKRAPLGKYLELLDILYDFPTEVLKDCFGGKEAEEILAELKVLKPDTLKSVFECLVKKTPQYAVDVLCCIGDIPREQLLYDEEIGLKGFMEIADAVIEVNELGKCISLGRQMGEKLHRNRTLTGFKN